MVTSRTKPTDRTLRTDTLNDDPDGVGESHGVVGSVRCTVVRTRCNWTTEPHTWEEEHLTLLNPNVPEFLTVNYTEKHTTFVLVEPLLHALECSSGALGVILAHLGLVDMIVIPLVRTSDNHDGEVLSGVDTVIVHGRLQEVTILRQPFRKVEGGSEGHGGRM